MQTEARKRAAAKYRPKRYLAVRRFLASLKAGRTCQRNCGEGDPACLDFHHRNPKTKRFSLGSVAQYSRKTILAEAAKCDLVCSNCHRKEERDRRERNKSVNL